jgi:hypothetical protein
MLNIFQISNKEYSYYIKYLDLFPNNELLKIANIKINNLLNKNTPKYLDFFLNNCIHYYYDIFFIDFTTKYFFKKSIIRFKLNLILALHEADYENFNLMMNSSTIKKILLDFTRFLIIVFLFPLWLVFKFIKLNLNKKK